MNFRMFELLINKISLNNHLNNALQELLSDGFIIHKGCYFLNSLYKLQCHVTDSNFANNTDYECFINSIHIDDYVDNDFFEQALLFVDIIIKEWNVLENGLILKLILGETDFGFNLKFHLYRENEDWINEDDIDNFKEGLMIFNSCLF